MRFMINEITLSLCTDRMRHGWICVGCEGRGGGGGRRNPDAVLLPVLLP